MIFGTVLIAYAICEGSDAPAWTRRPVRAYASLTHKSWTLIMTHANFRFLSPLSSCARMFIGMRPVPNIKEKWNTVVFVDKQVVRHLP